MSNALSVFENGQLPAHLQDVFGTDEANIDEGQKINALSIRGKVFRITVDGEERPLTRYNEETGDREPVPMLGLIILNQGPFGARVFYDPDKPYTADSTDGPLCFSLDGKRPDPTAREPQARTCAECPHSVKGSKVTPSGTLTTACSLQRRLAVVPAHDPKFPALLLRLAATSAYDPDTKGAENGWMAWRQYTDFLAARGVKHTAQMVTKVKFDPDAEHPKLLFSPARYLEKDEALTVHERLQSEEVTSMLFAPEIADEPEGVTPPEPKVEAKVEAKAEPKAEPKAEAKDEGGVIDADWDEAEPESKPKPKKTTKKKVSKKKASKTADAVDVERDPISPPEESGDPKLDEILNGWDV